jgi:hypothetical protein
MNITATKVKKILQKDYGWYLEDNEYGDIQMLLIIDTIKVVNNILLENKSISIKNK